MNTAKRVIAKFGGQKPLAEALGTSQSTVQYWAKKGLIPPKWHAAIAKVGSERGLDVDPREMAMAVPEAAKLPFASPEAKYPGALVVLDTDLPVYVLDDGRRVMTRTGALNFLTEGKGGGNLESYLEVQNLHEFLPTDLYEQFFDISIPQVVNKSVKAMTASAFIDICRAYSRARDMGKLSESQVFIAIRASMTLAAFAKTGIEAAIDEVTGYQYERVSDALQTKLKLFLEEEMRPWEKTFPDELWVQFGRLTRWKGPIHSRPKYWGKLVNELIYGYLDPDVFEWLKKNAPEPRKGRNYHSWMSAQYGLKKLIEHIWMTIGMATACQDMSELRQRMAERFGREHIQLSLYLPSLPRPR